MFSLLYLTIHFILKKIVMKSISLVCLISILSLNASSQSNCCSRPNATQLFAMLTSDENFVKTHGGD